MRNVEQDPENPSRKAAAFISPGRKPRVRWGSEGKSRRDATGSHAHTFSAPITGSFSREAFTGAESSLRR